MDQIYNKLNAEVQKAQGVQKDLQKCFQAHRQLSMQLSENESVKEELGHLTDDNTIYKLIGPVLIKQDLSEAKDTVDKRLNYIKSEM